MLGPIRQGLLDSKMQIGPDRTWDSVSQQYWAQQDMGLGVSDKKTDWARQEMGLGVSKKHIGPERAWNSVFRKNMLGPTRHWTGCLKKT